MKSRCGDGLPAANHEHDGRGQLKIARRSDVMRVHAWIRGVGNLQGAQSVGMAESPPFSIRPLIAAKGGAAAD